MHVHVCTHTLTHILGLPPFALYSDTHKTSTNYTFSHTHLRARFHSFSYTLSHTKHVDKERQKKERDRAKRTGQRASKRQEREDKTLSKQDDRMLQGKAAQLPRQ